MFHDMAENDPDCRAALQLIRATIEEHCPPGVLLSEDQVNGHFGPTLLGEAEALSRAIVLSEHQGVAKKGVALQSYNM